MDVMDVDSQSESDPVMIQGAEGRVYKTKFLGKDAILKERFVKTYRHPELDTRLTKERIRAEAKSILRCKNVGIRVPAVYSVDFSTNTIIMEYIANSKTVSTFITNLSNMSYNQQMEELKRMSVELARVIGKMHHNNIIHGDLTTSNILVRLLNDHWDIYLIDFGLSYIKPSDEDKAVDLYVLERAILSKHSEISWLFDDFLKNYEGYSKSTERVVKKLSEVRSRGRKRTMVG